MQTRVERITYFRDVCSVSLCFFYVCVRNIDVASKYKGNGHGLRKHRGVGAIEVEKTLKNKRNQDPKNKKIAHTFLSFHFFF